MIHEGFATTRNRIRYQDANSNDCKRLQKQKWFRGGLEKNLKEEEAFASWLEKNNPRIAKRLMKKQLEEKKKQKTEEAAVTATTS